MFRQRIKILIALAAFVLAMCIVRLAHMQLSENPEVFEKIEQLKTDRLRILQTARGRIIDRNGYILAMDKPGFEIHVSYKLCCVDDPRILQARLLLASSEARKEKVKKKTEAQKQQLQKFMEELSIFGPGVAETRSKIAKINNMVWRRRERTAWKRNYADVNSFEEALPNVNDRIKAAGKIDLIEMHDTYSMLTLDNEDDIFMAKVKFTDFNDVHLVPINKRIYPWGDVAPQVIGWVRPERDAELFEDDPLLKYKEGELAGFRGVEYICETILRGSRGRELYDIDKELVGKIETKVGSDVQLSLDIELQKQIQDYLVDPNTVNHEKTKAVVVIEVATGNILAMASIPVFNLNDIRSDYIKVAAHPNTPLYNRAIELHYPPGSVVKPLMFIIGHEERKISSGEVISCPAQPAPKYWPNCWIFNSDMPSGHDLAWPGENHARNAIKGSCNIYFSRLANRFEPKVMQKWLWNFGYGRTATLEPEQVLKMESPRRFKQAHGLICSGRQRQRPEQFSNLLKLNKSDLRWFGMGEGNFRVTVLQAANAMATVARRGLYKSPRLIIEENKPNLSTSLDISPSTLDVVYDGMRAVITEYGGTGYNAFKEMRDYFDLADVKIYGKTGSTQSPNENAWFGGFAKDSKGKGIALTILVEGGEHGSSDAAPLARDIIDLCIKAGYLGEIPAIVEE